MGGYNSSMHGGSNGGISVTPLTDGGTLDKSTSS